MAKSKAKPEISIIVPMYNESDGVDAFFTRVLPILEATKSWEIIAINDCSKDDTLVKLQQYNKNDKRIKIISFSRNFGKEAALTAGLHYCTGKAAIPIDADLQDPPELIPEMIKKWQEGHKVVLAARKSRVEEGVLKSWTASIFYKIMDRVSHITIPQNTGDFRLMDRDVIEAVKLLPEKTRFMKGLLAWPGFKTTQVYFERPARKFGTTSWNYWKLWQFALDGIFSFSTIPLKVWTYIGSVISLFAIAYAAYLIVRTIMLGVDVPGYASIMVTILFMGGIQLISLGVIGEYIARIYNETKQRPIYVVEELAGLDDENK
jgi:glycosyltransferase involved in cell wall biosynthesis